MVIVAEESAVEGWAFEVKHTAGTRNNTERRFFVVRRKAAGLLRMTISV
jgi:hypothetical protein